MPPALELIHTWVFFCRQGQASPESPCRGRGLRPKNLGPHDHRLVPLWRQQALWSL